VTASPCFPDNRHFLSLDQHSFIHSWNSEITSVHQMQLHERPDEEGIPGNRWMMEDVLRRDSTDEPASG